MTRPHRPSTAGATSTPTQQHDSRWSIAGPGATVGKGQPIQQRTRGHALKVLRDRWMRANPLCAHCLKAGRYTPAEELDHIVPLARGGTDADENLQSLCRACHRTKTARDMGKRPVMGCDENGMPRDEGHHWSGR